MPNPIRFVIALHNHQPIGNFDQVFRQAYQESYRPLLDVFADYPSLKLVLHISGSLLEWLEAHQPDYCDRLTQLVSQGRIEIIGGPLFEPILSMIPSRDRIGQIRAYTRWLQQRLGATLRGMWVPERVWEAALTRDIVDAGIEYTILDDFHFRCAGLRESQLHGYLVTEDEGRVLAVFPGSERLRYLIPFAAPERTIDYLARIAAEHADAVVVFGDDGEKFGTWPETYKHVYQDGWLRRFFDALVANRDWLQVTTLAEAVEQAPPLGKIYLPDCSYREMTEWALPTDRLVEYEQLAQEMRNDPRWERLRSFMRGGFWRNFRVKYPEANEMYARMMMVSRRLQELLAAGVADARLESARTELYRGQCNCGYWHGAFGGIYLPHLRNAVYRHLIAADNLLEQASGRPDQWIEAVADDFNFDTRQEIRLANDKLVAIVAPSQGGQLTELDVRAAQHNLLATLTRRPEAYHQKVLAGTAKDHDTCASIHERVVFKQENLDQRLRYDDHSRKSLVDLFYEPEANWEAVVTGRAAQLGDFATARYDARIRRNPGRIQLQLVHDGRVAERPLRITKGLTLDAGSATLYVAYLLDNLPKDPPVHFAVELNFAGLPAGVDDRYFADLEGRRLGHLGSPLDLVGARGLMLVDEWLGLEVQWRASRPTGLWCFPIESVSQSEAGFELVHQSVAVVPHWLVQPDAEGRWGVTMELFFSTSRAANSSQTELAMTALQ
jgi:alpha-amylase